MESGIPGLELTATPVRLDRHRVRCRDGLGGEDLLDHLDVQFLVIAPPGGVEQRSSESLDLRWWPWSALPGSDETGEHQFRLGGELAQEVDHL